MRELSPGETLVFDYPAADRVSGAAFLLLFFSVAVLFAAIGAPAPYVVAFLAFAGLGLYFLLTSHDTVAVDSQGVTFTRLGRSTRIAYTEITRLEHLHQRNALVIHAEGKRIRVKARLRGYHLFYTILSDHLPPQVDQPAALPLAVGTRPGVYLLGAAVVAVSLVVLLWILASRPSVCKIGALLAGTLLVGVGIVEVYPGVRKYVFAADRIEVHSLTGVKVFPVHELREIRLVYLPTRRARTRALCLVFGRRRLLLAEKSVNYSLEALLKTLIVHYGPTVGG